MTVYPAIDLKEGKAVRLFKGEMQSAKVYSENPAELAKIFEDAGAKWIHIVDLNGAFAGNPENLRTIETIRAACKLNIQLGGGIRDEETIKRYESLGISRLILGTIALKEPEFVKMMAKKHRIAVGIDAKDGFVATAGWADVSDMRATELAAKFADAGVEAIITTDIGKDGTLSGVNSEFTAEIAESCGLETIASGGVRDLDDIKKLVQTGCVAGVIIGKAYYEKTIDLAEAIELATMH